MKLRNKKTGEIFCWDEKYIPFGFGLPHPTSLAELNEEWEDYEEPKQHWFIATDGRVLECNEDAYWSGEKSIGNYFETEEEAEKAVEKLKAWKRLEEKGGFKFNDWYRDVCEVTIEAEIHDDGTMGMVNDLDLLFGGEE